MAWLLVSLRRLRDERAAAVGLACLVLVTAFVFAASPRLLDRAADDALRTEVEAAAGFARSFQLVQETQLAWTGDDPLGLVDQKGADLEALLPANLLGLFEERVYVVDSPRWSIEKDLPDRSFMRFRIEQGVDGRIRFVEGVPPSGRTTTIPDPAPPDPDPRIAPGTEPPEPEPLTVIEVALPVGSAAAIKASVGDTIVLETDPADPLAGRGNEPIRSAVEIVGLYEVIDQADPWWVDDTSLGQPSTRSPGGDTKFIDVTALLAPDAYPAVGMLVGRATYMPLRYTWRLLVDADRLEASRLESTIGALRRAEALFTRSSTTISDTGQTALRSGLLPLLEAQRARWQSAEAILTVVALGPAVVAAAAIGLIALFAARRRRSALALWRGRGASRSQVLGSIVVEGVVVSAPAVAIAALLTIVLLPAGSNRLSVIAAVAVAVLTTVLLVLASAPATFGPPAAAGRDADPGRGPSARRLVFEALVVGLAIVGIQLLRERGVSGASSTTQLTGADPFVALVPVLAGLAAGIIAIRLLPIPMRALSAVARLRRDLVPLLAMRRATSGGSAAAILVVLMATATIGAFSSAALLHLDRAAEAAAWRQVGADYRVAAAAGSLPAQFDAAGLPGVEDAAGAYRGTVPIGTRGSRMELLALNAQDFARVVAGTPADPGLPSVMLTPGASIAPAIVSTDLAEQRDGTALGEALDLSVEGYHFPAVAAEVRDTFPTMSGTLPFVIVSRDQLQEIHPEARLVPTTYYLRAPNGDGDALRAAVDTAAPGATVASQAELIAARQGSPIRAAVAAGVALAAIVAAAYAVLAVAAALALAGVSRAVEAAHLRMLGLSGRQAFGLLVVEHGPTIVAAFLVGTGLGLALFVLLRPGLGLGALNGTDIDVPLGVEAGPLALVLAAIVGIVAIGMALGAVLQRNVVAAGAVRRGIE